VSLGITQGFTTVVLALAQVEGMMAVVDDEKKRQIIL
jgi:hypothetical protein